MWHNFGRPVAILPQHKRGSGDMTETTQGGPEKGVNAPQREAIQVERDPMTGINKDMPGRVEEVDAATRDFGDRFCTNK